MAKMRKFVVVSKKKNTGYIPCTYTIISFFFPVALRLNAGHGLLIFEVSRSHTTTHHSQ